MLIVLDVYSSWSGATVEKGGIVNSCVGIVAGFVGAFVGGFVRVVEVMGSVDAGEDLVIAGATVVVARAVDEAVDEWVSVASVCDATDVVDLVVMVVVFGADFMLRTSSSGSPVASMFTTFVVVS